VEVLSLMVDVRLRHAASLKDRRAVVRTICEGARRRYSVAAADVGYQDRWQRARLGFATVAGDGAHCQSVIDAVERFVWSFPEVEVLRAERRWTVFED
jgi:uncharacterized protein